MKGIRQVLWLVLVAACPGQAHEVIQVYGTVAPPIPPISMPADSAELIKLAPGGAINRNGPLTAIPQYRGMHTYRLQAHVDGRQPHTAGPMWMDSPLHYLPATLVKSLEVHRGIAPVRVGSALGGYIDALSHTSRYRKGEEFEMGGRASLDGHSLDDGYNTSLLGTLANQDTRYHVFGVYDTGDDIRSGDHTIAATEHEREFFGVGAGFRHKSGEWMLDYARNNTGYSGTPVLPMDIVFYHSDLFNLRHQGQVLGWRSELQLHYQNTDHRMNNYRLRPAPDFSQAGLPPFQGSDRRMAVVDADSIGLRAQFSTAGLAGSLLFGFDIRHSENNATINDPDVPAFFVQNFNQATVEEYGVFSEWTGDLGPHWQGEFGLRLQRTRTDADAVNHFRPGACTDGDNTTVCPAPAQSVATLSRRFNEQDRSQNDTGVDAVAVFRHDLSPSAALEFGVAHKTRAPSYIERYLWVPLEANAGVGDGNNYIGDVNLDMEKSWQLELGYRWHDAGAEFSPRLFVRRVDGYITGIPTAEEHTARVSRVLNGDATPITFANVDAEFYGADLLFRYPINPRWHVNGTVSYVRGKLRESFMSQDGTRRIEDDSLYRMPPLHGNLSINRITSWTITFEMDWAARQSKISQLLLDDPGNRNNNTREVPGYALLNLHAQYPLSDALTFTAGVRNISDREYVDSMNAFNRVSGGDLEIGERIPGEGRNAFVKLLVTW